MNEISLDATDCRILAILQEEGRISNLDLADRISLSPSACLRRVRLLEEQGVIAHYRAHLSPELLGFEVEAFVNVSLLNDGGKWQENFVRAVRDWPEVVAAFVVTGRTQYLLRVTAKSLRHYSDFVLQRLQRTPGVTKVSSSFLMKTLKQEAGLPANLLPTVDHRAVHGQTENSRG
jgi:Lrp/AsnC family transcriptional regulator, leucine-responsive regulatory protein